ncbi:hypothetical protein IL54_3861 [Sphingobium sp. ba1]|nr:hypothetical protein IL54_3861 [Sphingobium sp. ba1]
MDRAFPPGKPAFDALRWGDANRPVEQEI